jgi:fructose/tagatose bisphosphate aldolase
MDTQELHMIVGRLEAWKESHDRRIDELKLTIGEVHGMLKDSTGTLNKRITNLERFNTKIAGAMVVLAFVFSLLGSKIRAVLGL